MSDFNTGNPFGDSYSPPPPPPKPKKNINYKKIIGNTVKILIAVIIVCSVVFSGIYTLDSNEEAVITAFGKYVRTEQTPGLKFKIPFVEERYIVDVAQVNRMEFGIRDGYTETDESKAESIMLTGDENLVIADWTIQYRISDSYDYLFSVNDPEQTLRAISEASYRRVVAMHTLDDILTNQKDIMQNEILLDLQQICNKYELGVTITAVQLQDAMPPDQVKDAFLDVSSAMEEKNAKINEASQYENEKLPMARGEASQIINDAEGYKEERINTALGDVARYAAIQSEYANSPAIMRTRMYLEMIQEVFPNIKYIYLVDPDGNTLNFLPLDGSSGKVGVQ